jgi:hypothetical protein
MSGFDTALPAYSWYNTWIARQFARISGIRQAGQDMNQIDHLTLLVQRVDTPLRKTEWRQTRQ